MNWSTNILDLSYTFGALFSISEPEGNPPWTLRQRRRLNHPADATAIVDKFIVVDKLT